MSSQTELAMAALTLLTLISAFGAYRWMQNQRSAEIKSRVQSFRFDRYGKLPEQLHVHNTDDRLWPILVSYLDPPSGRHHRLQFMCPGHISTFRLVSEKSDK